MAVLAGLDVAGRRRSPATLPGYHAGRPPRNKGLRYPADPPTVEEIISVMRAAGDGSHGLRLRAMIVVLWRGGLRIQEALAARVTSTRCVVRCWCAAVRASDDGSSAWTGGAGSTCAPGSPFVHRCPWGLCSVLLTAQPTGDPGRAAPCA